MENSARSERSRNAVIQAALTIIARDGPGRLTLDAIAREGGMSKGGLMHQFPNKKAVIKALLEHQAAYFETFSCDYLAELGDTDQARLSVQIAVCREASRQPHSVAFAIFGALAEDPELLAGFREINVERVAAIKAAATDPDLATLRWLAAQGILLTSLFGLSPLSGDERERLFDRLLDDHQWAGTAAERTPTD